MSGISAASTDRPKTPVATAFEEERLGRDLTLRGKVLIVEDEWLVSLDIEATLNEGGYETVGVAISADEALALAEQCRPDFVLMDIQLSGIRDGVDAALELERRLGLRCLFVSANSDKGMHERAASCRPLGWLEKPFSSTQLLDAVAAAANNLRLKP